MNYILTEHDKINIEIVLINAESCIKHLEKVISIYNKDYERTSETENKLQLLFNQKERLNSLEPSSEAADNNFAQSEDIESDVHGHRDHFHSLMIREHGNEAQEFNL